MSIEFQRAPDDHSAVIFTAIELEALRDHEEAISVLDYYVQGHDVDDVPVLIVQLYLHSLITLGEFNAAFKLLDRFVNAKTYTAVRAKEEKHFSAMELNVILSVEYIQLFNNIVDVYSTRFIEGLMREDPQNVLAYSTSFNKVEELFLEEPCFCNDNYATEKLFKQVVDRIVFVHNFIVANCISVMHCQYKNRDAQHSAYLGMIQLLLYINQFGDTNNRNLDSETCLNSINLHVKGALMCIALIRSLECTIEEISESNCNETNEDDSPNNAYIESLKKHTKEAKEHLVNFMKYASNWRRRVADNSEFQKCILFQQLGYKSAAEDSLDSFENQILILDCLNLTKCEDFVLTFMGYADIFRLNAEKCIQYDELEQNIIENIKLFIALGDIVSQQDLGFLALVLYSVAFKTFNFLAGLVAKRCSHFHMAGQFDSALEYYKNSVLSPFKQLLSHPTFLLNQRFEHLYSPQVAPVFVSYRDQFDPQSYAFDYRSEPAFDLEDILSNLPAPQNPLELRAICAYRISYIFAELATGLFESGYYDDAVQYASDAITVWPTHIAYFILIRIYNKLGDFKMARSTAIECGRFHPENNEAKVMSGEILGVKSL